MKRPPNPSPPAAPVLCGECHNAWPKDCTCPKPPADRAGIGRSIADALIAVALSGENAEDVMRDLARDTLDDQVSRASREFERRELEARRRRARPRTCPRCNGFGCSWCNYVGTR